MSLNGTYEFLKAFIVVWASLSVVITFFFAIIEIALSNLKISNIKYDAEKSELINRFNRLLEKSSCQKTDEILECLIEVNDLDKVYEEIIERNYGFIDPHNYELIKREKIDKVIREKFERTKKKEQLKSLYDELNACEKRFPQYKQIINNYIKELKN